MTPEQLIQACDLVLKALELEKVAPDDGVRQTLQRIVAKLMTLIWA